MKVRHKRTRQILVNAIDAGPYWFMPDKNQGTDGYMTGTTFPKCDYEPVAEEPHWQDVTGRLVEGTMTAGKCWVEYPYLGPSGGSGMSISVIPPLPEGYRLRRVQVFITDNDGQTTWKGQALLVERKVRE